MDPHLTTAVTAERPYFTRPELFSLGYDDRDIRRALAEGSWTGLRVGVYVPEPSWRGLDPRERHVLTARAAVERLGDRVALSHVTALAARGLVPDGTSIDQVHLLRLDGGAGRRESGLVHHRAPRGRALPLEIVDGMLAVTAAVAIRQVATRLDQKRTLALLDATFHAGLADHESMDAVASIAEPWPGAARFRLVLPLANALVQSPGETYVRWICRVFRLPMPGLQRAFRDERGEPWAYTDFDWLDGHHLGEFDGRVKYVRYLREDETVSDVVERERLRENRLRATGAGMTRFVWDDVLDRNEAATAARLRADLDQSRRLYVPVR